MKSIVSPRLTSTRSSAAAADLFWATQLPSGPVRLDLARPHDIEVSLASLDAPADIALERHVRRGSLGIVVDGTRVWAETAEFFTAEAHEVAIGRNPIGGTSSGLAFTGEILAAERKPRE